LLGSTHTCWGWREERRGVDKTCPISTEGWTRRVHFVRGEGGEGGVAPETHGSGLRLAE
jgi:hypothetical protein